MNGKEHVYVVGEALANAELFEKVLDFLGKVTAETDLRRQERSSAIIREILQKPEFARNRLLVKYASELSGKLDRRRKHESRAELIRGEKQFYKKTLDRCTERAARLAKVSSASMEGLHAWRREATQQFKLSRAKGPRRLLGILKRRAADLKKKEQQTKKPTKPRHGRK